MFDPYKVLGISSNATDDEVKEAYRKMAKKYHPDNYAGSPLADVATEKMKEVNEAYDLIMKQRKAAKEGNGSYNTPPYSPGYTPGAGGYGYTGNSGYNDVRNLINADRIADAEQILDGIPQERRNAEWHFLKGTCLYRRGWMDEAVKHFTAAVQLEPGNMEYRAVFNQINRQRNGAYGGFNPNMQYQQRGCSGCDVCSGLLCADCCCECFGGDCIRGC